MRRAGRVRSSRVSRAASDSESPRAISAASAVSTSAMARSASARPAAVRRTGLLRRSARP
jgi:hypothetical protein